MNYGSFDYLLFILHMVSPVPSQSHQDWFEFWSYDFIIIVLAISSQIIRLGEMIKYALKLYMKNN